MRKSLGRPLMIAFICRTSVAWLSTCSFYIWFHFPSLPSYIWPQDINLREFQSVSLIIERLMLRSLRLAGYSFGAEWFWNWQFHILPSDKSSDCCWGITEVEAHIGQNAICPDYATFYHITLFPATKFREQIDFYQRSVLSKWAQHLHLEWIELGTCGSLGQKLAAAPVMNYSIVGMEWGGLRLIRASICWDQRCMRWATGSTWSGKALQVFHLNFTAVEIGCISFFKKWTIF